MNRVIASRVFPVLSVIGVCASAHAAAPATERNFVACPIVLDTQDVPCWVAEYQGERYFLAVQTGRRIDAPHTRRFPDPGSVSRTSPTGSSLRRW